MIYKLKNKQRERLTRLAIYLDTLPADYKEFEMATFLEQKDDMEGKHLHRYARKNGGVGVCGTSACAVGHGPSAGIPVPKRFIDYDGTYCDVDWSDYAELFTGESQKLFTFLFSGGWSDIDNHHYGAAARIKYVLMGEDVPDAFEYPIYSVRELYAKYRKPAICL